MANTNASRGLLLYKPQPGTMPRIEMVRVKASTIVYPGQPLELASGVYNPFDAVADVLKAIAIGYASADASTPTYVLACTDPFNHIWQIQGDSGAFAATDIGKYGIITTTAANATLKQARNVITQATLAAAPGDISDGSLWEIVGKVDEAENVWGAYVDLLVIPRHNRIPAAA